MDDDDAEEVQEDGQPQAVRRAAEAANSGLALKDLRQIRAAADSEWRSVPHAAAWLRAPLKQSAACAMVSCASQWRSASASTPSAASSRGPGAPGARARSSSRTLSNAHPTPRGTTIEGTGGSSRHSQTCSKTQVLLHPHVLAIFGAGAHAPVRARGRLGHGVEGTEQHGGDRGVGAAHCKCCRSGQPWNSPGSHQQACLGGYKFGSHEVHRQKRLGLPQRQAPTPVNSSEAASSRRVTVAA